MQMRLSREELFLLLEESQQQNEAVEMEVEECRVAIENYKNIKEQLEKVWDLLKPVGGDSTALPTTRDGALVMTRGAASPQPVMGLWGPLW